MTGKGNLAARREDAKAVIGFRHARGQKERCLGQVDPQGDGLHLLGIETLRVEHHRDRIAEKWLGGEHVHDLVGSHRAVSHLSSVLGDSVTRSIDEVSLRRRRR
jgi:hypothetical protein